MNVAQGVPCTSTRKLGFHVLSECDHSDWDDWSFIGAMSARAWLCQWLCPGCVWLSWLCPGCVWLCPGCGCPGCVLAVLAVSMGICTVATTVLYVCTVVYSCNLLPPCPDIRYEYSSWLCLRVLYSTSTVLYCSDYRTYCSAAGSFYSTRFHGKLTLQYAL